MQGAAVFAFQGEVGSLLYMLLNVVSLLSVMYECQALNNEFSELCEEIIHLPTESALGPIGSPIRNGFLMALKRTDSYPNMTAFGVVKFSMENFYNAFIISLGSVASVLWVSIELLNEFIA
jgi:hypothetical protein